MTTFVSSFRCRLAQVVRLALVSAAVFPALQACAQNAEGERGPGVPAVMVRPGLRVDVACDDVGGARFMTAGPDGAVYLSRPSVKDILRLVPDPAKPGTFKNAGAFVPNRASVHGVQWVDGELWFTQSGSIHRAKDANGDGVAEKIDDVVTSLPQGGGHWWRSLLVTKDYIYTSIGDSGNINDETATERQKIWRFKRDGSEKELFASGLRNTEKLVQRPGTDEVWGADHGSDWFGKPLGDRIGKQPITDWNPPCEINKYVQGGFYGHPFVTGNKVPRYEFKDRPDIIALADRTIPPAWCLGGHVAPNAMSFLTAPLGIAKAGDAVVALHGSWNRKEVSGYSVDLISFDAWTQKPCGQMPLVQCAVDGKTLSRPVDVLQLADGSLLYSCDMTGRIYRISAK